MKLHTKNFLIIFGYLIITTGTVFSADLRMVPSKSDIGLGEQFVVSVFVDSDESLNAIEGKVIVSSDAFSVKDIRDGNSVINFWIDKPSAKQSGEVYFAGITPGGFSGKNKLLFSLVLEPKIVGEHSIELKDVKALINDSVGTNSTVNIYNTDISIDSKLNKVEQDIVIDEELPEPFQISLAKDPNLFEGKYFLVFSTQDKISGISKYKVREGRFGAFAEAESPYVLKSQNLNKKIYVKAIDKSGNERVATLNPQSLVPWYLNYVVVAIMALLLVLALFIGIKKSWLRFIR